MKSFMVGGAVRDMLLGRPVKDRDWVVVGSTAAEMLAKGFIQVGADFPVFLHPQTKEEYALARTERKTAPGYRGFVVHASPEVTLEQDLSRRDLTVNAIAMTDAGDLVDPIGGLADLRAGVLRHVSPAFREDPVRILRTARFAARYEGFTVAAETLALMRQMAQSGEVDSLVPERVWRELASGLMEPCPWRMLDVLLECGALDRILPELAALVGVPQPLEHHPENCTFEHIRLVLREAVKVDAPLDVRFACLMHDLGKALTPQELLPRHHGHEQVGAALVAGVCARLMPPAEVTSLACLVAAEHTHVHASAGLEGKAALRLLERCDALRRPDRFRRMLLACECDARGRKGLENRNYPQPSRLLAALDAASTAPVSELARMMAARGNKGEDIAGAIRHVRSKAIAQCLSALDRSA